ncbi:MAG: M48 family metallopeptidase [Ignavibacteria bacterium]|nr:M48 family metallopeptidase [Ignavibacteria bacterium]
MSEIKIDKLVRSKRRTIAIIVTRDAQLIVRAPFGIKDKIIDDFINRKSKWINKKLEKAKIKCLNFNPKQFVNGESFLYLGKSYPFKIVESNRIVLTDSLEFPGKFLTHAGIYLKEWYKLQLLKTITERVCMYSEMTGLIHRSIKITSAKKRFGSCSPNGSLNFSWRLMMAPLNIIDYVVVHELVHIEERNHSKNFWNKVRIILPDYKQSEKWLKDNSQLLTIE